jgi:hypothetical protein
MKIILDNTDKAPPFKVPLSVSKALSETQPQIRQTRKQAIRDSVAGEPDPNRATKDSKLVNHRVKQLQSALHSQTADVACEDANRYAALPSGPDVPTTNGATITPFNSRLATSRPTDDPQNVWLARRIMDKQKVWRTPTDTKLLKQYKDRDIVSSYYLPVWEVSDRSLADEKAEISCGQR